MTNLLILAAGTLGMAAYAKACCAASAFADRLEGLMVPEEYE